MAIFTGKHVEEAIEKGLQALGLSRSEASITVLAKEKKGFLGFGKQDAQVEVQALHPAQAPTQPEQVGERPAVRPVEAEAAHQSLSPSSSTQAEAVPMPLHQEARGHEVEEVSGAEELAVEPATPAAELEQVDADLSPRQDLDQAMADVVAYVEKIIYEMDVEATIVASHSRRQINLQLDTPEPGRLIGYHGKVLKALQLLAQNFLHDRYSKHFNLSLNVHDYLEHRTETLIEVTTRMAARVLETGKPYRMDPMSNSERKIVHKTVSKLSGVESYSEGNDPHRYVVIVSRDQAY